MATLYIKIFYKFANLLMVANKPMKLFAVY